MPRRTDHVIVLRPCPAKPGLSSHLRRTLTAYNRLPTLPRATDLLEIGGFDRLGSYSLLPGRVPADGDLSGYYRSGLANGFRPGDLLVHAETQTVNLVRPGAHPVTCLNIGLNMMLGHPITRPVGPYPTPFVLETNAPSDLAAIIASVLEIPTDVVVHRLARQTPIGFQAVHLSELFSRVVDATPAGEMCTARLLCALDIYHRPSTRLYA